MSQLKKLKKMLEQDVNTIMTTKIINTDDFQIMISNDNKNIYIDNVTETDKYIGDLLGILKDYAGEFITGGNPSNLNSEEVIVLDFEDGFNPDKVIEAIEHYEFINSDEQIQFENIEIPDPAKLYKEWDDEEAEEYTEDEIYYISTPSDVLQFEDDILKYYKENQKPTEEGQFNALRWGMPDNVDLNDDIELEELHQLINWEK